MYYTYIMSNDTNSVIYVGVTNDLKRRVYEHKTEKVEGFTKKYHIHKLVYYEQYSDPTAAISREKQLKSWRRDKKNAIIRLKNPEWRDLAVNVVEIDS